MPKINFQSGSVKFSIALFGRIVSALVGIVFVPVYVRLIGAESYGLVAFYGTLVGTLSLMDLGLSTAISRQVAILRTRRGSEKEIKDLVFSVELIYWVIGLFFGLLVILFSHSIAVHWVNAEKLPVHVIERTIQLMGLVFIFLFPSSVYNGVMIATEDQVPNSFITILFSLVKAIGVIFVLQYIDTTITTYFIWQALVTLIFTLALRIFVWKKLSFSKLKAEFSVVQLKTIWRFAAGMTGISLVTFFLLQADKIVVSKMVLLEFVGYYGIAYLLASCLNQVIAALQPVIFPKFAALEAQNRQAELTALYHKTSRWVAIIIFPLGFTLIFFAKEILMFWTHNEKLATNTAPMLRVLAGGSICNCMVWLSYLFLLAKGNTRFTLVQNTITSIIIVPLLLWLTKQYGAYGASFAWLIINTGILLIGIPLFHKYYLKNELAKWYVKVIGPPLLFSFLLTLAARSIQMKFFPYVTIVYFSALLFSILIIYWIIIPELRQFLFKPKFRI